MPFVINSNDLDIKLPLTYRQTGVLLQILADYMNDEEDGAICRRIITKLVKEMRQAIDYAYINVKEENNDKVVDSD